MNTKHTKRYSRLMLALLLGCSLSACSNTMDRLSAIGSPPEQSRIENPQLKEGYQPVSMPMPTPKVALRQPNSLWDSNRQAFFKDQRAANVGDILTVLIEINDKAELDNETERTRDATEDAGLDNLLGIETKLTQVLPEALDNQSLVNADSSSKSNGKGSINREEKINVRLAAVVTQVLPNGNFVIRGSQETRVNFENRILNIDGIIRPQDISVDNTVNYDQIAEARIAYGGKGQISDVQQARYGQQVYDILFPF